MVNKHQITPLISAETRELLRRACQEQRCSQGDIVEKALVAFLQPSEDSDTLKHLMYQQDQMAQAQRDIQAMVETMHAILQEAMAEKPAPSPAQEEPEIRIATNEEMYGPIAPDPAPASPLPHTPPHGWKRWFFREDLA